MERDPGFFEREKERKRQEALDTALAKAAANRDVSMARDLLLQGASPLAPSTSGWPMLIQVINAIGLHRSGARGRSEEIFQLLLDHGADPNQPTSSGQTSLHAAAFYGLSAQVRLLLERGARVDAADMEGGSPAHCVGSSGVGAGEEGLRDPMGALQALYDFGANFRALNHAGETAVDRARLTGRSEIALGMEALEALRERDEIQSDLPSPPRERRPSL